VDGAALSWLWNGGEAGEAAARLPSDWDVAALHELLWPGSPREGGSMGLGFGGGGRAPGAAGAAPQPPPAELSLAQLWLKMPSVMPLDVQWGMFGAAASAAAGLGAGLGDGSPLAMEGHIQPGCTLLTVDALVVSSGVACEGGGGRLSARAALRALLATGCPFSAFLRRQSQLGLGLERGGCTEVTSWGAGCEARALPADDAPAPLAALCGSSVPIRFGPGAVPPAHAAARMHGQTLPLRAAAGGGWTLAAPAAEGLAILSFARAPPSEADLAAPPARRSEPLLICADAAIVAEVLASASAAADAGLRASVAALGYALRFDPAAAARGVCAPELAAEALAACFARGWRASATRLMGRLASLPGPPLMLQTTGGTLAHAAAACAGSEWAVPSLLRVAGPSAAASALGGAASLGFGSLSRITPLHVAAVRGCGASLRALTAGVAGAAAFYAARDGAGVTPREALRDAALRSELDAALRPRLRQGAALFGAACELLAAQGVLDWGEALQTGPAMLASDPSFVTLRSTAGPEAMEAAAALFAAHALSAPSPAAPAAPLAAAEARVALAAERCAEAAERRRYDHYHAVASLPALLATLLLLVAYEAMGLRLRRLSPLDAAELSSLLADPGHILSKEQSLRLYQARQSWAMFPATVAMLALMLAARASGRARAFLLRRYALLTSAHWATVYLLGHLWACAHFRTLTGNVLLRNGAYWHAMLHSHTVMSALYALPARPHAALLCVRAAAGLLLVPSGRWPAATGLLSGDKTFSEFVIVTTLFQAGVACILLRQDAAAFAAWRAVQAGCLKAKAE